MQSGPIKRVEVYVPSVFQQQITYNTKVSCSNGDAHDTDSAADVLLLKFLVFLISMTILNVFEWLAISFQVKLVRDRLK